MGVGLIKNFLVLIFGIFMAVILFLSADLIIGYYRAGPFIFPADADFSVPKETLIKNPDPNVPEDFIVPYGDMFSMFFAPDVEARIDYRLWNRYDNVLGSVNGPNVSIRHQLRQGKSYIFNVRYNTDQYGRRITPVENIKNRKKFIAYFGCSFIWGSCLSDNETVPYYVAKLAPKYMPYNYARGASGSNFLLALMENREIDKEMAQKEGIGIYVFINDHVERSAGDVSYTASMPFMPFYEYKNGDLVRNGSFLTGRPWTTALYRSLAVTYTFEKFNINWPLPEAREFKFVCDLIEKSKNLFVKKFNKSEFYVLFHPAHSFYSSEIIPCLVDKKIKYLNFSGLLDGISGADYAIPYDGHPNASTNRMIAERLVRELKLNE